MAKHKSSHALPNPIPIPGVLGFAPASPLSLSAYSLKWATYSGSSIIAVKTTKVMLSSLLQKV